MIKRRRRSYIAACFIATLAFLVGASSKAFAAAPQRLARLWPSLGALTGFLLEKGEQPVRYAVLIVDDHEQSPAIERRARMRDAEDENVSDGQIATERNP